MSAVDVNFSMC